MRIGRILTAGTLGMGAYHAYQQYRGDSGTKSRQRGRGPLRGRGKQQRGGIFRR